MSKREVFITRNDFPPVMYELLKEKFEVTCWNKKEVITKNELIRNIKGKFAILCDPASTIDKEVIEAAGSDLKVVSTCSVGYDHLDVKELKSHGIKIGHTPNVLTETTAEHAVGVLLAVSRRIIEGQNAILKGEWSKSTWTPSWLCGRGLYLSTVGIVGCGRVGLSILKKIKSFNPSCILYYNLNEEEEANELAAKFVSLDELMRKSDFVIVALSQTAETRGIISKGRISVMKPNSILMNIGRGGLIDEEALIEALKNKKIGGAGLDVFAKEPLSMDSPLLKLDNVVITPHMGSATYDCRTAMAELAARNIIAVLNNEKMPAEL